MDKKFNFQVHMPSRKFSDEEKIGVMSNGGFTFLSSFYKEHKLHNFIYVVISYDKGNMGVGFTFTNNGETPGRLKLSHKNKNSAVVISTSFWRDLGIYPNDVSGKYKPGFHSENGMEIHYIILKEKNGKK